MSKLFIQSKDSQRSWWRPFPGHGQGVVVYNIRRGSPFLLKVTSSPKKGDPAEDQTGNAWIGVEVNASGAILKKQEDPSKPVETVSTIKTGGFNPYTILSYWLSYDRDNIVLKYGQGYRMKETTLIEKCFLPKDSTPDHEKKIRNSTLFSPAYNRYAELFDVSSAVPCALTGVENMIDFDFVPFVKNPSPFIIDSSKITLIDIDNALLMPSASLPSTCQELYNNVVHCEIDWMENHDLVKLSDAIRYSINTEGKTLYQKLKDKAGEFGDNPNETYLRVTLGYDVGGSPGIPYVLEIWPKDHYSPIHNHGNSFAVIKVLYGGLTVHVYNKMTEDKVVPPELMSFDVKQGDATWISPRYFQTHKLWNQTGDYCATIQCYMYGVVDNTHWPYFDYLDDTKQIDEFIPTSDFTFRELRDKVIQEFKEYLGMV